MSRTYRRRRGDPTDRNWILDRPRWYPEQYEDDPKEVIRELRRYHSDSGWCMSVPCWFNNQTCTRPLRVMFREFAHKVKRMTDLEDTPVFPKRLRRPWYW